MSIFFRWLRIVIRKRLVFKSPNQWLLLIPSECPAHWRHQSQINIVDLWSFSEQHWLSLNWCCPNFKINSQSELFIYDRNTPTVVSTRWNNFTPCHKLNPIVVLVFLKKINLVFFLEIRSDHVFMKSSLLYVHYAWNKRQ